MKKKSLVYENVEIVDIASEGVAIARVDGMVVFVPYVAPGDVVDIRVSRKKKSYAKGVAIKFHKHSPFRTEPFCEHFGLCGGCKWQHLDYNKQLYYKAKQVTDNLERIAKMPFPTPLPIVMSEEQRHYRNKLEYTFADKRWFLPHEPFEHGDKHIGALGFHIPGRFDKVLDINNCYLQPPLSNEIRLEVKKYCVENNLPFKNLKTHQGLMKNLIVRNSNTDEWMVIVVFGTNDDIDLQKGILEHIKTKFPQVTSLWSMINTKLNDSVADLTPEHYYGKPYLTEKMLGLEFQVAPKAFFQTNSQQAENLYKLACDFSHLTGSEMVYDLYTGIGTIANLLAKNAKWVVGVEYIDEAIDNARTNSEINGIKNTTFIAGDMSKVLSQAFFEKHGQPDVIVTDPPRAGMNPDVIQTILQAGPKRIVYVSCNPATQARDIAMMSPHYEIKKVQPVDMFPHTHHVENIVLLEKVNS
ncbi:MAG TPA: 23S rRNA (uracil(1939)-C(5))-methyltransferase RlmD [Salinivirgaceae bacterium]|nr:23S rRNA (uracil(1939)-C(5))-methyltransferase RlmD [Salinivirgaceae bacterium]